MRVFQRLTIATAIPLSMLGTVSFGQHSSQWPVAGQNLGGTRNQATEVLIGPSNVSTLTPKWVFTTGGDVSATPTVADDAVYFPDWAGNLYAVDRDTGQLIWSHKISDYDGVSGAVSRVSPVVHGDELIVGDIEIIKEAHDGANLMAVDRHSGALRWITKVDTHLAAQITGSPVVFGDTVYSGVSSNEESTLSANPSYPCCTFRGSVVALDVNTGELRWKTYIVPDNNGATDQFSGGAVWQPPAIDPERGVLYIGTGNNYTVPASVLACQTAFAGSSLSDMCVPDDDYFDTALALDLKTGAIRWSRRLEGYDTWTIACKGVPPNRNCPSPHGPDDDLSGAGPNLFNDGRVVGFGQKNGMYWALNPDNGDILWGTFVGPQSSASNGTVGTATQGGIEWGTATDGQRIYTEIADSGHVPYTLIPSGITITWGSWSALDAATGKILWQTPDPIAGTVDPGAVSVANGVVYAGSEDKSGHFYALDAATGKILWSFVGGGAVLDGPSIVDGFVYWSAGYSKTPPGNDKVYAFTLSGSTASSTTSSTPQSTSQSHASP